MELSRRSFLRGVLSVTAVTATGLPAIASVPRIVGDGVHDDADGLEALFARKPVIIENETIIAHDGYFSGGDFFVGRPLVLDFVGPWKIDDIGFDFGGGDFPGKPGIRLLGQPVFIDLIRVKNLGACEAVFHVDCVCPN